MSKRSRRELTDGVATRVHCHLEFYNSFTIHLECLLITRLPFRPLGKSDDPRSKSRLLGCSWPDLIDASSPS